MVVHIDVLQLVPQIKNELLARILLLRCLSVRLTGVSFVHFLYQILLFGVLFEEQAIFVATVYICNGIALRSLISVEGIVGDILLALTWAIVVAS